MLASSQVLCIQCFSRLSHKLLIHNSNQLNYTCLCATTVVPVGCGAAARMGLDAGTNERLPFELAGLCLGGEVLLSRKYQVLKMTCKMGTIVIILRGSP